MDFKRYRKIPIVISAKKMDKDFSCETVTGEIVQGKAGDYLCLDVKGFEYPCEKGIFEKTHEDIQPDELEFKLVHEESKKM